LLRGKEGEKMSFWKFLISEFPKLIKEWWFYIRNSIKEERDFYETTLSWIVLGMGCIFGIVLNKPILFIISCPFAFLIFLHSIYLIEKDKKCGSA